MLQVWNQHELQEEEEGKSASFIIYVAPPWCARAIALQVGPQSLPFSERPTFAATRSPNKVEVLLHPSHILFQGSSRPHWYRGRVSLAYYGQGRKFRTAISDVWCHMSKCIMICAWISTQIVCMISGQRLAANGEVVAGTRIEYSFEVRCSLCWWLGFESSFAPTPLYPDGWWRAATASPKWIWSCNPLYWYKGQGCLWWAMVSRGMHLVLKTNISTWRQQHGQSRRERW